jgi:PPOX class probable F420-dependent enzyme
MAQFPESAKDLLSDDVKAFAFLATIMEDDGTPQVTPVWFSYDGENILINSARGRKKDRNMEKNPNIALAIMDFSNPYRFIQVRGKVVDSTTEGARDHINKLSLKYTGNADYAGPADEVRVIYRVKPEHISGG